MFRLSILAMVACWCASPVLAAGDTGVERGQVLDLDANEPVANAWVVGTRSDCIGLGHCSTSCVEVRVAATDANGWFAFATLHGIGNFEQHIYVDGYVQQFRPGAQNYTDTGVKRADSNETYGEPDPITGRVAFLAHAASLMYCGNAPAAQRTALVPVYEAMFAEAWSVARYSEQKEIARDICRLIYQASTGEVAAGPSYDRRKGVFSSTSERNCLAPIDDPERERFSRALLDDDASTIARLVKSGFDPDRLVDGKQPPVLIATHQNHADLIKLLASLGAHVDRVGRDRQNALSAAVSERKGDRDSKLLMISALMSAGANSALPDQFGYSPLMVAVRQGDVEVLARMFEHGATANQQIGPGTYEAGRSAMQYALQYSHDPKLIGLLVEHGADVNSPSKSGLTPLMSALGNYDRAGPPNNGPYAEIAELLVRSGARIDAKDLTGRDAITYTKDEQLQRRLRDLGNAASTRR
jgi:hypothetical protein